LSISNSQKPESLVRRFLVVTADWAPSEVAAALGLDSSYVRKWRKGQNIPTRISPALRAKLTAQLERLDGVAPTDAAHASRGKAGAPGASPSGHSAPSDFIEHVIWTAAQISLLAQQIAAAAEQQKEMTNELGRRAQRAQLAMPDARERLEAEEHEFRKRFEAAEKRKSPRRA
jgi:hypothetical protein